MISERGWTIRQSDQGGQGVASGPLRLPLLQEPCPGYEIAQQLSDQVFRLRIEQVPCGIEPLGRMRNHHFWLINGMHV